MSTTPSKTPPPRPSKRPTFTSTEEEKVVSITTGEVSGEPQVRPEKRRRFDTFAAGMILGSVIATSSTIVGAMIGFVGIAMGTP